MCSDGSVFVRLNPRSTSLVALIVENNDHPPIPRPLLKNFSLTTADGLAVLKRLRNTAHAESLVDERPAACTRFASPDGQEKKKQRRMSRQELLQKRKEHVPIVISLDGVDVRILRPVQQEDLVYVEYDEDSISAEITCVRERGFNDESRYMKRDATLPKGVHVRGKLGYVMAYKDAGGRLKRMLQKTLAEAIEAQEALLAEGHETCGEEAGGDAES